MNQRQRENVLNQFKSDSSATLMLVSLKAGGVGLNLTSASCVFFLDLVNHHQSRGHDGWMDAFSEAVTACTDCLVAVYMWCCRAVVLCVLFSGGIPVLRRRPSIECIALDRLGRFE